MVDRLATERELARGSHDRDPDYWHRLESRTKGRKVCRFCGVDVRHLPQKQRCNSCGIGLSDVEILYGYNICSKCQVKGVINS